MRHTMPATIRYCDVDGQRIFLDLARDRYFQLPGTLDALFSAVLADEPADVTDLVRHGVLVEGGAGRKPRKASVPGMRLSFVETQQRRPFAWGDVITIWGLLRKARRDLRPPRLSDTLLKIEAMAVSRYNDPTVRDDLVSAYLAARPFVPIARNCLLDSLALYRFLEPSGIRPTLAIGVALSPFGAHAWLQDGGVILNDTMAAARRFTPILAL